MYRHSFKIKLKVKNKAGIFFHRICVESENDPYFSSSGLIKKQRYITFYGRISGQAEPLKSGNEIFNWISSQVNTKLESSLVKTDEFIFTSWPSLLQAMILEGKSYKLPTNKSEYKDILTNFSNDDYNKPTVDELDITIAKYKTDKNGINSNIKSFLRCSNVLISHKNLYLYDCFYYYFGYLVENATLGTNSLTCLLMNTFEHDHFELTSLHEFSKSLDLELFSCLFI